MVVFHVIAFGQDFAELKYVHICKLSSNITYLYPHIIMTRRMEKLH
jgi:hypothetical protein